MIISDKFSQSQERKHLPHALSALRQKEAVPHRAKMRLQLRFCALALGYLRWPRALTKRSDNSMSLDLFGLIRRRNSCFVGPKPSQ